MLIIEGPDGVGKTTLAKKLLARLPTHIYSHFSRLPRLFDYYWGYAERMSHHIVQDRFHLSEIVYAAVRGDRTNLDPITYSLVDAKIRLCGGYMVLLTADEEVIKSRWHGEQMYDLDKTVQAANLFGGLRPSDGGARWAFPEYRIDIDHHIHLTTDEPHASGLHVDQIIEGYTRVRSKLEGILSRREGWPAAFGPSGL